MAEASRVVQTHRELLDGLKILDSVIESIGRISRAEDGLMFPLTDSRAPEPAERIMGWPSANRFLAAAASQQPFPLHLSRAPSTPEQPGCLGTRMMERRRAEYVTFTVPRSPLPYEELPLFSAAIRFKPVARPYTIATESIDKLLRLHRLKGFVRRDMMVSTMLFGLELSADLVIKDEAVTRRPCGSQATEDDCIICSDFLGEFTPCDTCTGAKLCEDCLDNTITIGPGTCPHCRRPL